MKTKEEMLKYMLKKLHGYSHGEIRLNDILENYRNHKNPIGITSNGVFIQWIGDAPQPSLPFVGFFKFHWNFYKNQLRNQSLKTITGIYQLFRDEESEK